MSFIEVTKKVWLSKFGYPLPKWLFKVEDEEVVEPEIPLSEGDVICDVCKGWGRKDNKLCPKCFGNRKLDWIENVLGKTCTSTTCSSTTSLSTSSSCSSLFLSSTTTEDYEGW